MSREDLFSVRPSRGDTRPCVADQCRGTAQFGRRDRYSGGSGPVSFSNEEGWSCSVNADHFMTAAELSRHVSA